MKRIVVVGLLLAVPASVMACLWDHDTLKQERARFPLTLELITGRFLRHSPEFYEWRIRDRRTKLAAEPFNPALTDDLAAALDKTGKHDEAVRLMEELEQKHPGRYETAANLGTFHFHAGRLKEGLPFIDQALKINPDAHFGREKYQKLLVEYVLSVRAADGKLPQPMSEVGSNHFGPRGFAKFLAGHAKQHRLSPAEAAAAVKGITGMMRFGNHASPVLLEALGDLLTYDGPDTTYDAKRMAGYAYLKAGMESKNTSAYDELATIAIEMQTKHAIGSEQLKLVDLKAELTQLLGESETWYGRIRAKETAWIEAGVDVDAEFDKLYDEEADEVAQIAARRDPSRWMVTWLVAVGVLVGSCAAWVRMNRRRRGGSGGSSGSGSGDGGAVVPTVAGPA